MAIIGFDDEGPKVSTVNCGYRCVFVKDKTVPLIKRLFAIQSSFTPREFSDLNRTIFKMNTLFSLCEFPSSYDIFALPSRNVMALRVYVGKGHFIDIAFTQNTTRFFIFTHGSCGKVYEEFPFTYDNVMDVVDALNCTIELNNPYLRYKNPSEEKTHWTAFCNQVYDEISNRLGDNASVVTTPKQQVYYTIGIMERMGV